MGRTFQSVRMAVKDVSARWLKASGALKKENLIKTECGIISGSRANQPLQKILYMNAAFRSLCHGMFSESVEWLWR